MAGKDFEERFDDKLETLDTLLASVIAKTKTLSNQNKFLKVFNKKMEILLSCIDAYSIEDKEFIRMELEEKAIKSDTEKVTKKVIKKDTEKVTKKAIKSDTENVIKSDTDKVIKKRKVTAVDLQCKLDNSALNLFPDPVAKGIANNILDLIKSRESISLDDLVKGIKSSKYKVIEVLNSLIKERVIVKSFEKGFVYRMSISQDN